MRRSLFRSTILIGAAALAVPIFAVQQTAGVAQTASQRVTLPGSAPAWVHTATRLGSDAASARFQVRVYLAPRGGAAALDRAVAAVSRPGSRQYRHFLTPAQYRARFAPTGATVSPVKAWLASSGMHVTGVAFANRYVSATGSADAVRRAFGATIGLYRMSGRTLHAPTADFSVPASVASAVAGVTGLESQQRLKPTAKYPPPNGFRNARPCSRYYGQVKARHTADGDPLPKYHGKVPPYAVCGYTPTQFRGAYGATDSGLDGQGSVVAITDAYASPTVLKDANRYSKNNGDAPFASGQFSQSKPGSYRKAGACNPSGWFGEETLDVEAVHGIAPAAKVEYYAASSCYDNDLRDALTRVVDDNTADYVTNSWGEASMYITSGAIAAYEQIFKQAAMQGIGVLYSSGDNGDDVKSTGVKQTDYPTSDPYVTAVGGTSDNIAIGNTLGGQTGWGTHKYVLSSDGTSWQPYAANSFQYGAGGGFSNLFNRPDWQDGVVPASSPAGRAVPDIAMDADPTTGMLIGITQAFPDGDYYGEYRIGGTSLASPLMAGMQALASQQAGGRLGFVNPAIYDLARTGSDSLTDVLAADKGAANIRPDYANGIDPSGGILYSVRTLGQDSSLKTTEGWDDVTGVGSPNSGYFAAIAGGSVTH